MLVGWRMGGHQRACPETGLKRLPGAYKCRQPLSDGRLIGHPRLCVHASPRRIQNHTPSVKYTHTHSRARPQPTPYPYSAAPPAGAPNRHSIPVRAMRATSASASPSPHGGGASSSAYSPASDVRNGSASSVCARGGACVGSQSAGRQPAGWGAGRRTHMVSGCPRSR